MANQIPENAPGLFDVHLYVNPETLEVEGMFAFTFFGMCIRDNSDWVPVRRNETRLDEFTAFKDYEIDWDVDHVSVKDLPEGQDLEEHPVVLAYDTNTLTWDMINKYCVLVSDENGRNPEAANQ
jgi:hypothetical protein